MLVLQSNKSGLMLSFLKGLRKIKIFYPLILHLLIAISKQID